MGHDRALIFDFDGLVVATEDLYADAMIEEMAARRVVVTMADIAHLFGSTGPENEAMWDALLVAWGAGLDLDALEDRIRDRVGTGFDELEVLPGVVELLDAADEAGWRTALATGKARWRLDEHLARLGIGPRFEVIVTAEEVAAGKPAPDIFLEAARRLGVAPGGCVVLEDSLPGCLGARAAGMVAVACPSRVTESVELPPGVARVSSLLEVRLEELVASAAAGPGGPWP